MPFTIDNSNSVVTNTQVTFSGGGIGTMTADAFVFYTGVVNAAVQLNDPSWTVTINGVIEAVNGDEWALGFGASTGSSKLTIGETGVIESGNIGVFANHTISINLSHASSVVLGEDRAFDLRGNNSSVTNKGFIGTTLTGSPTIEFSGTGKHTVTNNGLIQSGTFPYGTAIKSDAGASNTITNTGQIVGSIILGGGNDVVSNAGYMYSVALGDGNNTLSSTSASSIIALDGLGNSIVGGSGNDTITNKGQISGVVALGEGVNKVTNSGTITGGISAGSGNDAVSNTKSIKFVNLGDGNNSVTGTGTIDNPSLTAVTFGGGNDTLSLSGKIQGHVVLGDGTNSAKVGELVGNLTGGTGNDTVTAPTTSAVSSRPFPAAETI